MIAPSPVADFLQSGLDRRLDAPLYRQVHDRIRQGVLEGRLPAGARLPSSRALAAQLGLARATVQLAYDMLAAEGFTIGQGAAGTRVAAAVPAGTPKPVPAPPPDIAAAAETLLPFQMGQPALDAFPRKLWSRLAARRARSLTTASLAYAPPAGEMALRLALQRYLAVARGVVADPAQIIITAGFQGALTLVAAGLLAPGDGVWVEDPGYFIGPAVLRAFHLDPLPVPVDDQGIDVAAGPAGARAAIVTPSHQFPTGVALSLERRLALLDWAAATGAWIVEDDYDAEFRYAGRPLPALQSLDSRGRVLFAGTFSKVMFPALRLGYLVAPRDIAGHLAGVAARLGGPPAAMVQLAAADFIDQGHFARHIRRMRHLYATRRQALYAALMGAAGGRLAITLRPGGQHLMIRLPAGSSDTAIAARARAAGLAVEPLSGHSPGGLAGPGLLLTFTNVDVAEAGVLAQRLAAVL